LRVSPVGLDLPPGQNAATLSLFNDDAHAVERAGAGVPLAPGTARTCWSRRPGWSSVRPSPSSRPARCAPSAWCGWIPKLPERQEAYRLIVDELPPPLSEGGRSVTLLMRHSIPLFFAAHGDKAKVEWRLIQQERPGPGGEQHGRPASADVEPARPSTRPAPCWPNARAWSAMPCPVRR
jgi:fimbrial chaperone protein